MKIHLILPALNEEVGLPPTMAALTSALAGRPHRFVVVDDGSTDRTAQVARDLGADLVQHASNRGLGAALHAGFREGCQGASDQDVLITLDADNTQPAALAPRMADLVAAGDDLVIASRYRAGARVVGVGLRRKLLSAFTSFGLRLVFPIPGVTDYSSGYRAYRVGLLRTSWKWYGPTHLITTPGFVVQVELLFRLSRIKRLRITELPILLRYDRKVNPSAFRYDQSARELIGLAGRELGVRRWPASYPGLGAGRDADPG